MSMYLHNADWYINIHDHEPRLPLALRTLLRLAA